MRPIWVAEHDRMPLNGRLNTDIVRFVPVHHREKICATERLAVIFNWAVALTGLGEKKIETCALCALDRFGKFR